MAFRKLTPYERKIVIKARRLRRKKSLQEQIWEEQDDYLKDIDQSDTEKVKERMRDYINNVAKISEKERLSKESD